MAIPLDAGGTAGRRRRPVRRPGRPRGRRSCAPSATRGARFREDALRMLRAVRFAATLGFTVEPATRAAIAAEAPLAAHRLRGADLRRAGAAARGRAAVRRPAARRGDGPARRDRPGAGPPARRSPRPRSAGDDLWDHTCRTVDAAAPTSSTASRSRAPPRCSTTSGKPATFADGHFVGHESGRGRAGGGVARRASGRRGRSRRASRTSSGTTCSRYAAGLVRRGGAAVHPAGRRSADVEELLDLRAADNVGSGLAADADGLDELRARCREQLGGPRRAATRPTSRSTATT